MDNGWIKLHRKLLDNPIAQRPNYAWLWVSLLLMANHKDKKFMWNGKIEIIKDGQLLTGRKELAAKTGIPEGSIDRLLNFLESEHQIEQQTFNKFRIITIVNWTTHQSVNTESNNKRTTDEQQANTNKNVKNDKNDKKMDVRSSLDYFKGIPLEDKQYFLRRFVITEKTLLAKAEELQNYCLMKGKQYRDYRAFLLNAAKRDFKERTEEPAKEWERPENRKIDPNGLKALQELKGKMMSNRLIHT